MRLRYWKYAFSRAFATAFNVQPRWFHMATAWHLEGMCSNESTLYIDYADAKRDNDLFLSTPKIVAHMQSERQLSTNQCWHSLQIPMARNLSRTTTLSPSTRSVFISAMCWQPTERNGKFDTYTGNLFKSQTPSQIKPLMNKSQMDHLQRGYNYLLALDQLFAALIRGFCC